MPVPAAWEGLRQIHLEALLSALAMAYLTTNRQYSTQAHTFAHTLRDQDKARGPRAPSGWSARPRDGSHYRLCPLAQGLQVSITTQA